MITAILIIYLIGFLFWLGVIIREKTYTTEWWCPILWPYTIISLIILGGFKIWESFKNNK